MKIKHAHIENFRSIKQLDFDFNPLLMFIGPNNHGKTNIISALAWFFGEYNVTPEDFFMKCDNKTSKILIELTFNDLDNQDKNTFKSYILPDGTIKVQKSAFLQDDKVQQEIHGVRNVPVDEWLWPENAKNYTNKDALNELSISVPQIKKMIPSTGRITLEIVNEIQNNFIEENRDSIEFTKIVESGAFLGAKNVGSNIFGDFILIPPVKEISQELTATTKTALGRLLSHAISDMLITNDEIIEAKGKFNEIIDNLTVFSEDDVEKPETIQELQDNLSEELQSWGSKVNISLPPPIFEDIFRGNPTIKVNDGVQTGLELKGHGLQRYFMFALIKVWTKKMIELESEEETDERKIKARTKSKSIFFVIEEPELFLHPQAQRQMHSSLKVLAEISHHQVIFCTHSSFFIDMNNYKSICIVTKPSIEEGTKVHQVKKELFEGEDRDSKKKKLNMAYWFNPDRSEMFFSKKVILVEGHSEKAFFPFIAHRMEIYDESICLVDCGGKGNIPLYQEILNSFELKYLIVHDEDPVKVNEGQDKYREQKRLFQLNEVISKAIDPILGKVEVIKPNLDEICGISPHAKSKPLSLLEKFDANDASIPPEIVRIVKSIYQY